MNALRYRLVFASRFFPFVLMALLLTGQFGCCKSEVWSTSPSPDGKWTAVTVVRDCGATTHEAMAILLRPSDEDSLHDRDMVFGVDRPMHIEVSWRSNNELLIDCRGCKDEQIRSRTSKRGLVQISYTND